MVSNFLTNFYVFYRPDSTIRQNQRFTTKNDPKKSLKEPCKWDLRKYSAFLGCISFKFRDYAK